MHSRVAFVAGVAVLALGPGSVVSPQAPVVRRQAPVVVQAFSVRRPAAPWSVEEDPSMNIAEFTRASTPVRTTTLRIEVIPVRETKPPMSRIDRATMLRESFAAEARRRARDMRMRTGPMAQADTTIGCWHVYMLRYSLSTRPSRGHDGKGEQTESYLLFAPDFSQSHRIYHFRVRQWYAHPADRAPAEMHEALAIIPGFRPLLATGLMGCS